MMTPCLVFPYPNFGVCGAIAHNSNGDLPIIGFAIPVSVGWMGVVPDLVVRALPLIEQGNLFNIHMGDVSFM